MQNKILGGILLVAGTTIGAGMLALPAVTGHAGFFPSILLFVFYWAFFAYTALLVLETTLWMDGNTNLTSMARRTTGKWGEVFTWVVYLFLLYSLSTAYLAGSSDIVLEFLNSFFKTSVPGWVGPIPLLCIFGFFVYRGARYVDGINRILMCGLMVTYAITIYFLAPHVDKELLFQKNWRFLLISNSVIATSFGFHIIIPTLSSYMNYDVKKLFTAIVIGSCIPLVIYILWEWVSLGILPLEGDYGIIQGYREGYTGAHLLTGLLKNDSLTSVFRCFAFFAIVTSFLGVTISLHDFLADGFKIHNTGSGKIKISLLTFLPIFVFMWINPRAFLTALEYAGGFGVMLLLGFLPALMVWKGRYTVGFPSRFRAPGGKKTLLAVMVFSWLMVLLEVVNKLGFTHYITGL